MDYTMTEAICLAQRESIELFARRVRELTGFTVLCHESSVVVTPHGDLSLTFKTTLPEPPTASDVFASVVFPARMADPGFSLPTLD